MPILLDEETEFASIYSQETGRPNWSVTRMLGLSLLQESYNLDDQKALDCLSFDVRWQHALGMTPEESYLSRRSLVDFRSRLVETDPEMKMLRKVFDKVGATAIEDLGISIKEQRVDSTLITSNIFTRGRIELFRKTLVHFLDWLSKEHPESLEHLSSSTRQWYEEIKEGGWFGKVDKDKVKQLTSALANRLYEVVRTFSQKKEINSTEPYELVERLFNEHCELKADDNDTKGGDSGKTLKVKVRKKAEHSGSSLQSPYDPDAGCSYKGPGYLTHVTETCNNETTEIITDFELTSAAETDRGKDADIIDRLADVGKQPKILYEDGGYPTGQGLIDAEKKGTKLIAPMTGGRLPEGTIGRDRFEFNSDTGHCTGCPAGHAPLRHAPRTTGQNLPPTLHAYFDGDKCRACDLQSKCIVRKPNNGNKGNFHLEVGSHLIARDKALAEQGHSEWWERYSIRAGAEATMSELKRGHGLGKLRVRRMPRVRLAVGFKITACNVKRWLRALVRIEKSAERAQGDSSVSFLTPWALLCSLTTIFRRSQASVENFAT
ncbi:MAG: transposase [Planctomycetota bacterium]